MIRALVNAAAMAAGVVGTEYAMHHAVKFVGQKWGLKLGLLSGDFIVPAGTALVGSAVASASSGTVRALSMGAAVNGVVHSAAIGLSRLGDTRANLRGRHLWNLSDYMR